MKKQKSHLPLYGVGPWIVFGQFFLAVVGIVLVRKISCTSDQFSVLQIPLLVLGMVLIAFGAYLNWSAKRKSKLFQQVKQNQLITDGVYAVVRNPVYSAALLVSTGMVLLSNHLFLLVVPVLCWIYMTIFLVLTEEKWLRRQYGSAYVAYCKQVNRCIPWIPKANR